MTYKMAGVLLALAAAPCWAQTNLPARILHSSRQIELAADGATVNTSHVETKILTQVGITALAQTKLGYREMLQELEIKQAYTLKPDGRKLMVAPDAIITQQAPASATAAMLDDSKQKVIIYSDVEIGDVLVQDTVTRTRPLLTGNFMYDTVYPAALAIDDASVTLSAPKGMSLQVENRLLDVARSSDGDRQVLTVHYRRADADPKPRGQSSFDIAPRLSISTFKSYDALAQAYAGEAMAAAQVTPAIQLKADEVVAGTSDRREQARKLYDWVSGHVRYVALEFGKGGIIPRKAEQVMTTGYGDCKDHAVLYIALLKARGIAANLVIISAGDTHTLAKVPTIAPFNHVITWLPELRLYADTTAGQITPFGFLPPSEYGKPVMHIEDRSGALHQVPVNDGAASSVRYKQTEVADEAGHVISNSELTAKGGFVLPLRVLGQVAQGQDAATLAEAILKKSSTPRATGTLSLPPLADATDSYQMLASYSTPGVVRSLAEGVNVGMRDNLRPLSPFSIAFFGPLISDKDEAPAGDCYNGHALDEETLEFPVTRTLTRAPSDSKLDSSHVHYLSHWSAGAHTITVRRELTTRFEQNFCTGAARAEMTALAQRLKDDLETTFAIPRAGTDIAKP